MSMTTVIFHQSGDFAEGCCVRFLHPSYFTSVSVFERFRILVVLEAGAKDRFFPANIPHTRARSLQENGTSCLCDSV